MYKVSVSYLISGVGYTKSWPIRRHRHWGISVYNVTVRYLNQWCRLYKSRPICRHRHRHQGISMYKVSVSYLNQQCQLYQKVGQYVGIGLGDYQCQHRTRGISVYNVTICYVNQWCWLYKKSAITSASASASGNTCLQSHFCIFKMSANMLASGNTCHHSIFQNIIISYMECRHRHRLYRMSASASVHQRCIDHGDFSYC